MTLKFPHEKVRPSQGDMMRDVIAAIENKRHLVADAPTGLGKTAAVLFPAAEYATDNGKTVFFLTSRLSQHKMAVETLQAMNARGVDIVGKKWLCSHDVQDMDSSSFSNFCSAMVKDGRCKYYKRYKQKGEVTEEARNAVLQVRRNTMHSEDAKAEYGDRFCTYELLMGAARGSPVIVADYFHMFGNSGKILPRISREMEDVIIVVDEAHNLPDRIRSNLSRNIGTRTVSFARRENDQFDLRLGDYIDTVEDIVQNLSKRHLLEKSESFVDKSEVVEQLEKSTDYDKAVRELTRGGETVLEEKKRSAIDRIAAFLDSWRGDDHGYARILSREMIRGKPELSLYYNCLDPSLVTKPIISESHSTILMSGTLSPMEMYRDLLGMDGERTELRSYESPFPAGNRKNIIARGVTTRYKERGEEMYQKISDTVARSVQSVRGNVAVFFPSYKIMDKIFWSVNSLVDRTILMEEQGMTKEQRKHMQEEFAAMQNGVLFGVLAGSFSEGIDLPGDALSGVIVVGVPLERPTLSVKALIDYYDERFSRGRAYGYFYPAIVKVMQAAGRCIRSERDRGVCVFADERFTWSNYSKIFPRDWDFAVTDEPESEIRKFFS